MIGMISVKHTADRPNFPLRPLAVFVGSSMTLGVVDVPPTREGIAVTGVSLAVENAVGAVSAAAAVESGGVWTATIPASHFAAVGVVAMGVTITASGTDENGAARSWIVGKGDLSILPADGVPVPGETLQNVHLRDSVPETPAKGDLCEGASGWQIYTGDAWAAISPDLSNYATKADATLAERTGFSEWTITAVPEGIDPADVSVDWGDPGGTYGYEAWYFAVPGGWFWTDITDQNITSLADSGFAATRTALQGYQLGSDDQHILASEAEAEALRTAVAQKYAKPSDGIPKSDLAEAVQTSLGKADAALPKSGGTMTGALNLGDDSLRVNKMSTMDNTPNTTFYGGQAITTNSGADTHTRTLPAKSGTLALTSDLPPSETWTFEVDDGQGGTTTVTKSVAVYAAGGNA